MRQVKYTKHDLEELRLRGLLKDKPAKKKIVKFDRYKNDTEREYARILETRKRAGEIIDWKYEPYAIRLAACTHIRPDWIITDIDYQQVVHETKGKEWPQWKAKWKIFKEMYQHEFRRFLLVKKINGVFKVVEG